MKKISEYVTKNLTFFESLIFLGLELMGVLFTSGLLYSTFIHY